MKIASIVGARPNFVKLAPLSRELRMDFEEIIVHTGQHYDYELNKIFFDELGIPAPNYHLEVGSGTHGFQTGEMIKRIEEVLREEKAENTDCPEKLKNIVDAFCEIRNVVFPCHPRTENCLKQLGLWDRLNDYVKIIDSVGYFDMLMLEKNAKKILTDSGGVQKEAYILGVPGIILRENTEWVETVEDGWNVLTGAKRDDILKAIREFEPKSGRRDVFGKGDASKKITHIIANQ